MAVSEAERQKTEQLRSELQATLDELRSYPDKPMSTDGLLDPLSLLATLDSFFDLNISIVESLKSIRDDDNREETINRSIRSVRQTMNSFLQFKKDVFEKILAKRRVLDDGAEI